MSNIAILEGLEEASKKHEKEIVIEFATDRFLHTLGVHFMILLAIIAKVTEVVSGKKCSCYPATADREYGRNFILYSNVYCWESSVQFNESNASIQSNATSCATQRKRFESLHILDDPNFVKGFVQWIPYAMVIEAFFLSLPSVWWHFRVGARLVGHLKFMKLLLEDIYNATKTLPGGIYHRNLQANVRGDQEMTDRDMFSLLCHENFSSMMHHTYVTSIFDLTTTERNINLTSRPLRSTVLEYWCHKNNFGGQILIRSYEIKHLLGIASSTVCLFGLLSALTAVSRSGLATSKFLCDVLFHENACLLCTIPRMADSIWFLFTMIAMTAVYVIISMWRLLTFRKKNSAPFPDFLSSCRDENEKMRSIALLAAYKKAKDAE